MPVIDIVPGVWLRHCFCYSVGLAKQAAEVQKWKDRRLGVISNGLQEISDV